MITDIALGIIATAFVILAWIVWNQSVDIERLGKENDSLWVALDVVGETQEGIARILESLSPTNVMTSTVPPAEQVTLDEMADDTAAHGGFARSVDYFANLDRDITTHTDDPSIANMCLADCGCAGARFASECRFHLSCARCETSDMRRGLTDE